MRASVAAGLVALAMRLLAASITDLEVAFGVPLLEPHSRGVRLTPAGEAEVDQMDADLSAHAKGPIGPVRRWANTSAVTRGWSCRPDTPLASISGLPQDDRP